MNWLQRFAVRLAARVAPPLGKLLNSAGGTVDRLLDQNEMLRRMLDDQRGLWQREAQDLREAIEMSTGIPWHGGARRGDLVASEAASVPAGEGGAVVVLKERLAELELALEDRGWQRQLALANTEFSRYGIQQIILISRLYFIKNPLIRRGVQISAYYVFGRGVEITSPDKKADEVLKDFFDDPRNASELSHTGLVRKEESLYTDGNLFWALFTAVDDGSVLIRSIDATEIEEVICNPDDSAEPWYYHRRYMAMSFNPSSGITSPMSADCWYVALGFDPPPGLKEIGGKPIMMDKKTGLPIPILHKKRGGLPKWKFGCPIVYGAIDWARSYRHGLEDYCSLKRAHARLAWGVETQGGVPAIAAWKQTLATTLANDGTTIEQNPPPTTASALITGPGNKVTPFKVSGLQDNPEELRRVLLMVCAHFGLPETFFGDASTGSLATAQSLDRPTELKFLETQEDWRETLQTLGAYVLFQSGMAIGGKIKAAIEMRLAGDTWIVEALEAEKPARIKEASKKALASLKVNVIFPSILEHDITSMVTAIVDAMTLNGFQTTGIDERIGVQMLLEQLGAENPADIVEDMYPEAEYAPNRTEQLNAAKDADLNPPTPPAAPAPGAMPGALPPPTQDPAKQIGAAPVPEKQRTPRGKKTNPISAEGARAIAELRRALIAMKEKRAK